jgi:hypothetical protein
MSHEDWDRKLSRMLAAVGAEAEPALLTRARARIEARPGRPVLVRWVMRPAALGAALGLFVASAGLSFALISNAPGAEAAQSASLMESLLEERGIVDGTTLGAAGATVAEPDAPADSGGAR